MGLVQTFEELLASSSVGPVHSRAAVAAFLAELGALEARVAALEGRGPTPVPAAAMPAPVSSYVDYATSTELHTTSPGGIAVYPPFSGAGG
jgi:hypothetical protein